MENISRTKPIRTRDKAYYRRRQQNRVFEQIVSLFADEASNGLITKKVLAEKLGKDPAQITRWLSAPANLELDTISDMLLAMGAEMDFDAKRFADKAKPNYEHPYVAQCADTAFLAVSVQQKAEAQSIPAQTSTNSDAVRFEIKR